MDKKEFRNRKKRLAKNLVGFIIVIGILFCVFMFNIGIGFSVFEDLDEGVSFAFIIMLAFIVLTFLIFILATNKNKR